MHIFDTCKETIDKLNILKQFKKEQRVLWLNNQKIIISEVIDDHIDITLLNDSSTYRAYYDFTHALYKKIPPSDPILNNVHLVIQELYKRVPDLIYDKGLTITVDLNFFLKYQFLTTNVDINLNPI